MSKANSNPTQRISSKEPWLSVNLSMLFPGLGQIYSRQLLKGLVIAVFYLALTLGGGWLAISFKDGFLLGSICILLGLLVSFWSLFDAHCSAKKLNSKQFENLRKSHKDPWLAVFYSRIIPGIGHIYVGKTFTGIFLVVISLIIPFIKTLIFPFVAYKAYVLAPVRRERNKLAITVLTLFLILSIFSSLVTSVLIRSFVAEARYIPSGSMEPTLQINDRLIIDKISYHFQTPQRGDIIVFSPTEALKQQNFKDAFIKRIIGLPGETVEVKDGKVYINGQFLSENYLEEPPNYQWGVVTVPPNSYAVFGDNRNNAYDSHYWGFVPRENIIGKATQRFWPLNRVDSVILSAPPKLTSSETSQPPASTSEVDSFQEAIETGMIAAILTQSAKTQKEWGLVVKQWQKAIDLLKSVPKSSDNYGIAQIKVEEYTKNLKYAKQQL